jgi:hypothetical protein
VCASNVAAFKRVARCGSWGREPSNQERDLHRFARHYLNFHLEKYCVACRVVGDEPDSEVVTQLPMFLPHEFLAVLYDSGQQRFAESCFGHHGFSAVGEFWSHTRHLSWSRNHPARARPECLNWTIPACLFADDGRLYRSDQMMILELSMFLSKEATAVTKFILAAVPHWLILKGWLGKCNFCR